LLSGCFHFTVSQFFVSSLFLVHISLIKHHCISITQEELTGFQEEDHDDLLEFILNYNKDMQGEGMVLYPPLIV